jgi:D-glycero-D-manno-heptose 1,7-bisphosphate phosphatase
MLIVILDRDGVINFDSDNYIRAIDEWRPIPGSIEAIARLSKAGYSVYVATNQSGLARGFFSLEDLHMMHEKLESLVYAAGGEISGIYFCPHHPDDHCDCRKPNVGLLQRISQQSNDSLQGCPFVGDSLSDIRAAKAYGCKPVLVETGKGQKTLSQLDERIDVFQNLASFVDSLLNSTPTNTHK